MVQCKQIIYKLKKTKLMPFGPKNLIKNAIHEPLYMNVNLLYKVHLYKYLSITLDPQLTFNLHLANVIQYTTEKGYFLRKIRPYLNNDASLTIYKSMILPYVEYGDFFYQHAAAPKCKKLQTLQNCNMRLCLDLHPRANVQWIHQQAKLNLLEDRRNAHLLNFMYKRSQNPQYKDIRELPLRQLDAPSIIAPNYVKTSSQLHIDYRGASAWNSLPVELRCITTYNNFK